MTGIHEIVKIYYKISKFLHDDGNDNGKSRLVTIPLHHYRHQRRS